MPMLQSCITSQILWIIKLQGPLFQYSPWFCFSHLPQQSAAQQIKKHFLLMAGNLLAVNFTECPQVCVLLPGKVSQGSDRFSPFPLKAFFPLSSGGTKQNETLLYQFFKKEKPPGSPAQINAPPYSSSIPHLLPSSQGARAGSEHDRPSHSYHHCQCPSLFTNIPRVPMPSVIIKGNPASLSELRVFANTELFLPPLQAAGPSSF